MLLGDFDCESKIRYTYTNLDSVVKKNSIPSEATKNKTSGQIKQKGPQNTHEMHKAAASVESRLPYSKPSKMVANVHILNT